jgi:hypothetical protein
MGKNTAIKKASLFNTISRIQTVHTVCIRFSQASLGTEVSTANEAQQGILKTKLDGTEFTASQAAKVFKLLLPFNLKLTAV